MSKQILTAVVILLGGAATAAAQTCALPAVADSVELQPLAGSDLVTVPVAINGTPRQFLLDVGTNAAEVSNATAAELHLPPDTGSGDAGQFEPLAGLPSGSMQQMSASVYDAKNGRVGARVRISAFTIGGATGHNIVFGVAKDPQMGKSEAYDGLLTDGFFKQYDIELDFGGKKANFLTSTSCSDPDQLAYWPHAAVAVVPMTMVNGKMQVPVTIDGHSINAVIDTSSARTVMRRDIAEGTFGLKTDTPGMMPEGDLRDGEGLRVYGHTFPQISFGGVTAQNVPVLVEASSMVHDPSRTPILGSRAQFSAEPLIPGLVLGMDVLHQLHLYAVFGQANLYVTAAK